MTAVISDALTRSRMQLMLRHPYLASAIARLPFVDGAELEWCDTLATDGYYIYVDPDFCATLTEPELSAVIAHEVLHCVLGHADRRGSRGRILWNVAVDYAANLLLVDMGFELPAVGLLDRKYRGMTAETIYDVLLAEVAENAGSEKGSAGSNVGDTNVMQAPGGFDRHLEPGDIEGAAHRAGDFPSAAERRRLRAQLGREMASKLPGREAGLLAEEIRRAGETKVSWQQLLARFFTGLRRDDYRTYPFNRKHLWRGIYLPSVGVPGPEHIVIAVDTSGSMSNELLSQALAEIDALRSTANCKLTLIQCDAVIQDVREYEAWELSARDFDRFRVIGRGGTSLVPPFEWVRENVLAKGLAMDAMFYVTDGYGPAPAEQRDYPTIWLVPETGFSEAPFGEVIRL